MNRRTLIVGSAIAATGLVGVLGYRRLVGNMHGMAGMPGMHGMEGLSGTAKRIKVIPEGEKLRDLPKLANLSTMPSRFEARITAGAGSVEFVPGKSTAILGYNGSTPGPMIEVTEGDAVSIDFENMIGNQDSTIHWHGLLVPPDQDGNPMNPVRSGSARKYDFTLQADNVGPFWYHPHPHGITAEQTYMGLAAPFIVRPKSNPLPAELAETTLFITSLSLLESGAIAPNTMLDLMNGREGDHVLVNGQKNPMLTVAPGSSRRFRLYNATNGRYLRLAIPGHRLTLIGTDGGFIAAPIPGLNEITLAPAERAEVVVDFQSSAGRVVLQDLSIERGWMGPGKPPLATRTVLTIDVSGPPQKPVPLPGQLRRISALGPHVNSKTLAFGEKMSMAGGGMAMEFLINNRAFDMTRVDLTSRVNDVELWEIVNPTDMDHPLHLHGTQFQIFERERNGQKSKEPYVAWKDTVNVARGETVRFKVKQEMVGRRMYHCHILEHEQQGMMGLLDVV